MSKETTAGVTCRCGRSIFYAENHWPHCEERDKWTYKKPKREGKEDGSSRSQRQTSNA